MQLTSFIQDYHEKEAKMKQRIDHLVAALEQIYIESNEEQIWDIVDAAIEDRELPEKMLSKPGRPWGTTKEARNKMIELRDEGLTYREIGARLGWSATTVHNAVHRLKEGWMK